MSNMFTHTGYNSTVFTLDLGNKFYTSRVTDMGQTSRYIGRRNNPFILDLTTFDFSNVTSYEGIFWNVSSNITIWVKDATAQAWVVAREANLTTSNVLIKGT